MKTVSAKDRPAVQPKNKAASNARGFVQFKKAHDQIAEIRSILNRSIAQKKAFINPPGDAYEREADAVADKIVAGQPVPLISRLAVLDSGGPPIQKPLNGLEKPVQRQAEEEEEELLQTKLIQRQPEEEEEELLQPKLIQRQPEEEEEELLQPKLIQRQPVEEEEEFLQPKLIQRQP